MNKKLPLIALTGVTLAGAQGLYDVSNSSGIADESSFRVTASARVGYDDNVSPVYTSSSAFDKEGSAYVGANLRITYSEQRSNASLGLYADLGVITYLDDIRTDDITPVINLGAQASYKVNRRIQLATNNRFTHGLEPDYERGIANDRRSDAYTTYSSYNSIGIRWTRRFATRHSINFQGADYGSGTDYSSIGFRNSLRYRLNDRTILKASHTYGLRLNNDSTFQNYSAGFEHSFSERTGIDVEVGGNSVDLDSGYDRSGLFVNATATHISSDQLSFRGYVRYGIDDIFTTVPIDFTGTKAIYQARKNLRIGGNFNYKATRDLDFYGGLALVNTDYIDSTTAGVGNSSALIFNINAGLRYHFSDNLAATLNYNHTESISDDIAPYEYGRNRYSVGVEYTF